MNKIFTCKQVRKTLVVFIFILPGEIALAEQTEVPAAFTKAQKNFVPARIVNSRASYRFDTQEYKAEIFDKPFELPYLPVYAGQYTFMRGVLFPHVRSGATYSMRFTTKEDTNAVLAWYRTLFTASPWTLYKAASAGTTLAATDRAGNFCQLTVFSSYKRKNYYRTEFIVLYKASKKAG